MDFNWLMKDPPSVFAAVLIVGGLITSQGTIRENQVNAESIRQQRSQITLSNQHQAISDQTAKSRYQSGCVPIVDVQTQQPINLTDGMVIVDPITHAPLPVGTVVCDASGNTGVVAPGVNGEPAVGQIAFTGDREIVQESVDSWDDRQDYPTSLISVRNENGNSK